MNNSTSIRTAIRSRLQRGVTLLEVLVSLLILSLGLLGYAGLQAVTVKNNHNAYLRSQATTMAYNVLDRMRANRAGISGYVAAYGAAPSGADALTWKADLEARLPYGEAAITYDATTGAATVSIKWFDSSTGLTSQEFSTRSQI